jgi:glycosyltransferase involved in cell wall biosynthesis
VIVPVRNEMAGLGELVRALRGQAGPDDEIVFVDAGSTDGTDALLREQARGDPRVRVVSAPGAYPGAARNAGIRLTDAGIIAQIDGGNMPEKDWLPKIVAPILGGEADYVSGDVEFMKAPRRVLGLAVDAGEIYGVTLFRGPNARLRKNQQGRFIPAGGASAAYRREVWERAGGFPEWLRFGEDPLFVERVMQQDPRVAVAEDAMVYWQIGPGLRQLAERYYNRSVNLWRLPWGRVGPVWLPFLASLAASCAAAVAWPPLWPLPAALAGLAVGSQTARSARAYRQRAARTGSEMAVALCMFVAAHAVELAMRIAGTFTGLFFSRGTRRRLEAMRREYLGL